MFPGSDIATKTSSIVLVQYDIHDILQYDCICLVLDLVRYICKTCRLILFCFLLFFFQFSGMVPRTIPLLTNLFPRIILIDHLIYVYLTKTLLIFQIIEYYHYYDYDQTLIPRIQPDIYSSSEVWGWDYSCIYPLTQKHKLKKKK